LGLEALNNPDDKDPDLLKFFVYFDRIVEREPIEIGEFWGADDERFGDQIVPLRVLYPKPFRYLHELPDEAKVIYLTESGTYDAVTLLELYPHRNQRPKQTPHDCHCEMPVLMSVGCKCGGV